MQLYLILEIFVSDAWLAPWIFCLFFFFWKFLLRIVWNDSARRVKYAKHILFSLSAVEKEFCFIWVIKICCKQGILIKSCRYWLLNWHPKNGKLFSDPFSSKVICFRALVSFMYSQCTPIRGNGVTASGMRHQQKLKKFVKEFNCRYQWV